MLTQEQALTELRQLNQELGLPEDDGVPMTQAQAEAELRALDEELASTPESFGEYVERRKVEDSRSLGDKTSAFTDSFLTGAGVLAKEGSKAISELFSGDVGASEVGGVFQVGINDFGRFAKTLGGAAMDNFYSDENEMQREYQRYKDNFLYNQEVRPAMLETYDEEGRDFVSFGANFVDPTLLIPGAGLIAKGGSLGAKAVAIGAKAGAFAARSPRLVQLSKAMAKTSRGAQKVAKGLDKASDVVSIPAKLTASGTRQVIKKSAFVGSKIAGGVGKAGELTSKVAGLPRAAVTGLASKVVDQKIAGSGILGAQVTGALTGQVPGLGLLTGAEALGYIANKTGRGVERTLSALSSTGGQKRFLQRLATTADSPRLRKLALMAHAGGATKLTDLAFNSLVNGASVGALNGALAYAAGEGAEGVGAAVGSGTLMGGSLPFGQPGMKGGKSQVARDQSSINFLNAKLADDQIKQFQKLSPDARLAFATVEEAGIRAPKLAFLDKQTYIDLLRQDDPNLRQAPNAHYDMGDNTIYVNQDGNAGRSSKEAMDILTHELGHHFITQGIKDDPLFARKILEQYEAKPGEKSFEFAFTKDSAGAPIDSIMLNEDAKKIASAYDNIQEGDKSIGVGQDANLLAQEIGAEQFAMMMVDNPNYFNTIEPSLRQKLLEGSRKVLTMFGAVDPYTGNPLDISISPILKRNKQVRNLYKNYIKQREKSIVDKIDLAEKGVSIKVRKGESADQAVERMFGAQGISLKDSGAFRINNKKVKEKLSQILNRLDEQPEGPMSSERNPKSGKPQSIVGKELSPELKNVFTRNDPRGTINVLINDITESIKNRIQLNFLYRSGKPSKYSDNELKGRVVSPVRFKVTGLSKGSRSAASLKMDAIDEAYLRNNVEVLVKEGFAKDPNKLIEQAREVARQAMDDPEGRINPEGNFENELITAVFGMEQSAPQIRNARLRQLLEDKKLQHAYRSYDVDALAGIAPTGKSGIAFDYFNIKNNYSPFDDKLFMPRESKGLKKKVLLRTTDEIVESIKAEAKSRGISANDVYNERLANQLPAQQENPQLVTPKKENDITLTPEELRLLKKTNIGPEDAEAYRQAVEKRRKLAEASILGEKLFMPTIEERKASKYGKQLSEAQRLDKSIISDARKEWNELGYEAPNFQRFMKLEDEFGADPPALATLQNNGNFKPQELYYVGDMGVAKNANYDAVINIRKRLFDEVDRQESHRWNEDETITVTTDRKKARELQKKLDPDHVPLVLASNAKYIFDPSNPEHIASLKLPEGESFSTNPVDVSLFEPEIKARGWHGYRVGDEISIFDSTRLKLIKDQSAETKLFSKDRPFGKVSGLFGQKTPLDRFDSSTSKDLRFMPLSEEIKARNEWLSKTFSSKNFQDFITRKGKPNFALKNKDGDYLPVPWYHGGTIGIKSKIENKLLDHYLYSFEPHLGKLKDWTFEEDITWLSSNKEFAREYTPPTLEIGDQNPIMVATNISNVFDYNNPKHIKILKENTPLDYYQVENIKVGEWRDIEPHLGILYQLGFDGARMKEQGKFWSREPAENVAIFNRQDIKLIKDVNDVGRSVEVSGKFIGEQLFLPQLKFDFDGKGSAVEMSPVSKDRAPTFWKLFKINPKDPKVYDKVADVLIDTGTPSNDPANALDHAGKLGLDPKKLRQAMARAQRRYFNQIGRFYMPTAYHGTPHTLAPEPGAPLGKFRTSAIGTGEGAQAYGHGLYFAGKKEVADYYRRELSSNIDESFLKYDGQPFDLSNPKHEAARMLSREAKALGKSKNQVRPRLISLTRERIQGGGLHPSVRERIKNVLKVLENKQEAKSDEGSLYKVELAPKENEYLLYDKTLGEQPKGVQDKLKKFLREQEGEDNWQYRQEQDYRDITNNVLDDMPEAEISRRLKEAGIPGIKYLDGSSRSKGEGDYNYVIFDEADVTVTEKLFMPASEAGAGKGKVAEAAKLWQEKGTDSPYFKKWFGKSKVVDENGEPLVVYHGTPYGKFSTFMEGDRGMWFADNPKYAEIYKNKGLERFDDDLDYQADLADEGITRETLDQEKKTFEVFLSIQKPYDMTGFSMTEDMTPRKFQEKIGIDLYSEEYKFLDQEEPAYLLFEENYDRIVNTLKKRGFDGIISREDAPAFGPREALETKSFVPFKAEQIKSATGNRGTFDAGERNINYMPSDPKAPTRQPANRITRQAPAMPGNRFMLPAASAGAKSAERFR